MLGLKVMINQLFGDQFDMAEFIKSCLEKRLVKIILDKGKDKLFLSFDDKKTLCIYDDGQSCCEQRYMTTDDVLDQFIDSELIDILVKDGPTVKAEYGDVSECQFLDIKTSKGVFTVVTHNEHNGYYGGFSLVVKLIQEKA